MLKRLVIFISIVVGGMVYLLLNRLLVGVIKPEAEDLWAWVLYIAVFAMPIVLTAVLGSVHCLISWIVWGELIAPQDWVYKIKSRKKTIIHEEYVQQYKTESEEKEIIKQLDKEYPGMEG